MILNLLYVIVGIVLVLWGADKFTDGACGVARRWRVSELVIGLTVVAMGTSLPELMVSLLGALRGSGDMSVGNIVGSNIFNTLVIVGFSATAVGLAVSRVSLYRDLMMSLGVALILYLSARDAHLSHLDATRLLLLFAAFVAVLLFEERRKHKAQPVAQEAPQDVQPMGRLLMLLVVGIGALVGGGQLLVSGAADLARAWGVEERVIGLTILAGGTSLPELATSVVAARKGSLGLAIGNALGSNIFNITLVLGLCALISPMDIPQISTLDWTFLLAGNVVLGLFMFTGMRLVRTEGVLLLLCYAVYMDLLLDLGGCRWLMSLMG